ncbi:kielin/chordin-like protein [Centruroides vittatus]|uniref:kielin/chordin-like protein n=1 Tax=Centruroides vittatus TaxID=120091 RepID=UPI00350FEB89
MAATVVLLLSFVVCVLGKGPESSCALEDRIYRHGESVKTQSPCDNCFCFKSSIICWSTDCPTHPDKIQCRPVYLKGVCCPIYECPISSIGKNSSSEGKPATSDQIRDSTDTPSYCLVDGTVYKKGQVISSATGPCILCRCGSNGQISCQSRPCPSEIKSPDAGTHLSSDVIKIKAARHRRNIY